MHESKSVKSSGARRASVFALVTLAATACLSGVDTAAPVALAAGTYTLTTVDAVTPPVLVSVTGGTSIYVTAAAILLGSDGSAQHIVSSYASTGGVNAAAVTDTATGTFVATDTSVVITFASGAPDTLALTSLVNVVLTWNRNAVVGGTSGVHAFHYTKL